MNLIYRNKCVITGENDLEHLHTFDKFPILSIATLSDESEDVLENMSFWISKRGVVQLNPLIDPRVLYNNSHGTASVGNIWKKHNTEFADFISEFSPTSVLEIGGGVGIMASLYIDKNPNIEWTIIDPSSSEKLNNKIKSINEFFDNSFPLKHTDISIDTIVHSHTLEHIYDPVQFLQQISQSLKVGQRHIFSVPYMEHWLQNKYSNTLFFEHTLYLTEEIVEEMLLMSGFKIIRKKNILNHSIFYATEKTDVITTHTTNNSYKKNKKVYLQFIDYYRDLTTTINYKLEKFDGDLYIFGSHIFTQLLINSGLNTEKVVGILDNDVTKQNKRLYGTKYTVFSPNILTNCRQPPGVVLHAGIYTDEIKTQILSICPTAIFF